MSKLSCAVSACLLSLASSLAIADPLLFQFQSDRVANRVEAIDAAFGPCETQIEETSLELKCLQKSLSVKIDVIQNYEDISEGLKPENYLLNRAEQCTQLTARSMGRCITTEPTRPRLALSGYSADTTYNDRGREMIYFVYYGPHIIRAVATANTDIHWNGLEGHLGWLIAGATPFY